MSRTPPIEHPAVTINRWGKRLLGMTVSHNKRHGIHAAHAEPPALPRALQANPFLPENFGPTLAEVNEPND